MAFSTSDVVVVDCLVVLITCIKSTLSACRAVADEQRSLTLGVQSVFFRLLFWCHTLVPGPIAFGAMLDSGCIYWQFECNRRGNCWVYDNNAHVLCFRAFAVVISGLILNLIFRTSCWLFYPLTSCESGGIRKDYRD